MSGREPCNERRKHGPALGTSRADHGAATLRRHGPVRRLPAALAAAGPRSGGPARTTGILACLASLLVLLGSFRQIGAFFLCAALVFVALAAAALFRVRHRAPKPAFLAPGYPATPALFVLLLLSVAVSVAAARPGPALVGLGLVLLGLPARHLLAPSGRVKR